MVVETYEQVESNDIEIEDREQCADLCKTLGLEGQQSLMSDETKEICPYRKMTKDEYFVYSKVLTAHSDVKKYSDGPIPLRVLQVIAHATALEFFEEVKVWHAENADIKDPIAVGVRKDGYDRSYYLLARWGDALAPLAELRRFAVDKYRAECRLALEKIKHSVEGKLSLLAEISDDALAVSGDNFQPSYYGH